MTDANTFKVRCFGDNSAIVDGTGLASFDCTAEPAGEHWRAIHRPLPSDMLSVAAAVWLADRACSRRSGMNRKDARFAWAREILLDVEVHEPERWNTVAPALAKLLHFLTDDAWTLRFEAKTRQRPIVELPLLEPENVSAVCLFSGGLDSTLGLHRHASQVAGTLAPVPITRNGVERGRLKEGPLAALAQEGHGLTDVHTWLQGAASNSASSLNVEKSQRSRGVVFLLNIAAVALAAEKTCAYVYEPGVGAFNPSMSDAQVGAFNTRAMHPGVFDAFESIVSVLSGSEFRIEAPHILQTKGELCGLDVAATMRLAPVAVSCDRGVGHRADWKTHCGKCTSCLLRRASMYAAVGSADPTTYLFHGDALLATPELRVFTKLGEALAKCRTFDDLVYHDHAIEAALPYFAKRGMSGLDTERQIVNMMRRYAAEIAAWTEFANGPVAHSRALEAAC